MTKLKRFSSKAARTKEFSILCSLELGFTCVESLISFYHHGKWLRRAASKPLKETDRLFAAGSLFTISMKKGLRQSTLNIIGFWPYFVTSQFA